MRQFRNCFNKYVPPSCAKAYEQRKYGASVVLSGTKRRNNKNKTLPPCLRGKEKLLMDEIRAVTFQCSTFRAPKISVIFSPNILLISPRRPYNKWHCTSKKRKKRFFFNTNWKFISPLPLRVIFIYFFPRKGGATLTHMILQSKRQGLRPSQLEGLVSTSGCFVFSCCSWWEFTCWWGNNILFAYTQPYNLDEMTLILFRWFVRGDCRRS